MIRFSPNPNRAHLINWYEWGEEAFRSAREQNKPVMVFLSAFWCRYCQRMDEEAFSETENIALLRAYFIPIRAENAQRPDLDVRYNQNGWPTIVFMKPDGEPVVAANYLPSDNFQDVVLRVYMDWQRQSGVSAAGADQGETEATRDKVSTARPDENQLAIITDSVWAQADRVNGGYGAGQKFIQPEVNDFLLARYEATGRPEYLDHVRLTLDRIDAGAIHDREAGGIFRTSTGPDWDQPHREKLLGEQAGLIANCLWIFRLTRRTEYLRLAEDIVGYLDAKLWDDAIGAFYGCEDFLRVEESDPSRRDEFFTIIDRCVYTDANALAIVAYLEAAALLNKPECQKRALRALNFLRQHCRYPDGGMYHYYHDGQAYVSGWLSDQVSMGTALLAAHRAIGEAAYLDGAIELGHLITARFNDPAGGYYDLAESGYAYLNVRLTLIEHNGPAAGFFLALAKATSESRWRAAASWALSTFTEDLFSYGVHAAAFGRALSEFFQSEDSS